ncbi:lytic transglycosylase domain-containing protein [Cupriavidus gilardii]|uniref:lytic transglycosylase domain-containing protein n=1 Tax=Cupriavidus gilardii TaxID=82541 RepID=UPI0030846EB4
MRTTTAVPVIALIGGLAASVAHADDPAQSPAWTVTQAPEQPQSAGGPLGNVWGVLSAAEREARAIVASEQREGPATDTAPSQGPAAPAGQPDRAEQTVPAPAVRQPRDLRGAHGAALEQLALSTLARHAARAMGQDNARVLGLDAIAPTVEPVAALAEAQSAASVAPRARPVAFQPDAMGEGGMAGERPIGGRGSTRPRHAQLALAPPNARLASAYDDLIEEVARQHDVAPHLVRAVIKVESNFQAHARSPKGAVGLMQVMPATGRRFGAADLRDPRSNVSAGTQYLRWLLNRFDQDLTLALAAYNAGEGAVEKYGRRIPPFAETQGYVSKVLMHLGLTPGTEPTASPASAASGGNGRNGSTADAGPASAIASRTDDGSSPKTAGRPPRSGSGGTARQQADATLRTVSNWIGALLTSSSQPAARAATNAAAATTPTMAIHAADAMDATVDASTWTRLPLREPVRTGPV